MNFKNSILSVLALSILTFSSCEDDNEMIEPVVMQEPMSAKNTTILNDTSNYTATINLTQLANNSALRMNTTDYPYTNALNQSFNVTKLQYLISDVTFFLNDSTIIVDSGYHYVDLTNSTSLTYMIKTKIPAGTYSSVGFTFGFDEEDNISGAYTDLNTLGWNWPAIFGGGYHFLRLEGEYLDSNNTSAEFKTHMGTASDGSAMPRTNEINHFDVILPNSNLTVSSDFSFDIEMNIEEWYTNPIDWDFNVWNAPVMPISAAQKALNSNGSSVFTFKQQ